MWRHAPDAREHFAHLCAAADDSLEPSIRSKLAFELQGMLPYAGFFYQSADPLAQWPERHRLVQVIAGSPSDSLDGGFGGIMRRHEDHVRRRLDLHAPLQQFHATDMGHHQLGEHDLRAPVTKQIQSLFWVGRGENLKAGLSQRLCEQFQTARVIVDDEQRNRVFDGRRRQRIPIQENVRSRLATRLIS